MMRKSDTEKSSLPVGTADTEAEQLEYIRAMALELRAMALDADAPMLAYLLEMSALEAAEAAKTSESRVGN